MKRYNLKSLMLKAWSIFRKASKKAALTFSEALRLAWRWIKVQAANAEKVQAAAEAAGVKSEYHSWAGWKALGREVIHESKAAFQVKVDDPTTKSGTRIKSFFLLEQTEPIPAEAV